MLQGTREQPVAARPMAPGVVLVDAIVGFLQEHRAERAILALRSMTAFRALVIRDGRQRTIPAAGDITLVIVLGLLPVTVLKLARRLGRSTQRLRQAKKLRGSAHAI